MSQYSSHARALRMHRLCQPGQRIFIVPLDHSVTDGPIVRTGSLDHLVGQLADNGVDAVVLHKGSLRFVDPRRFADMSLVVHLSASTVHALDPNAKYLVAGVEEALRRGADAVSVHVNLGSQDESRQIADLAAVADACDRWQVPLLAMMYPRGPKIDNPRQPELVAHAVTLAADLGADIVKTVYTGTAATMADITGSCPIPVVVAGGAPRSPADIVPYVKHVLAGGVAGVAMGRNIFRAPKPGQLARTIAEVIHRTVDTRQLRDLEVLAAAAARPPEQETDHEALLAGHPLVG